MFAADGHQNWQQITNCLHTSAAMTILPKRNKRRLDQREQDSGQSLNPQSSSGTLLDVQQAAVRHNSHTAAGQKIDTAHGLSITHPLNHGHSHYDFNGRGSIQQSHRAAYNAVYYNHLEKNGHGSSSNNNSSRLHHHHGAALAVDTKWRSPPLARAPISSEDKYLPPVKKQKRPRAKQKQNNSAVINNSGYDYSQHKLSDNPTRAPAHSNKVKSSGDNLLAVAGSVPGRYDARLPFAGAASQSRQMLRQSGTTVSAASLAQLSPKMPGGAQQKSGAGQRSKTPDSDCDSGGAHENAPSPGGCNSEDEHVPTHQEGHYTEEVSFNMLIYSSTSINHLLFSA